MIHIDGERFASLMMNRVVGVHAVHTFTIVKLDEDYFEERPQADTLGLTGLSAGTYSEILCR